MNKKSKKGITLVELICTIAMMGIVLVVVGALISTFSAQFVVIMDKNNAKTASAIMLETIEQRLRLAKSATFSDKIEPNPIYNAIYINDDGLLAESSGGTETVMFEKAFYKGLQCKVDFSRHDSRSVEIFINFEKNSKEVYSTSRTIMLLNTKPTGAKDAGEVKGGAGHDKYLNYTQ
ncbi:MAG: type II secretion system protein [Oscillospiraceae bacterium]